MDIVKKINILIGLMLGAFIIFVVAESFLMPPQNKDEARFNILAKKQKNDEEENLIKNIFKTEPPAKNKSGLPATIDATEVPSTDVLSVDAPSTNNMPNILSQEHGAAGFYNGQNGQEPNRDYLSMLRQKMQQQGNFWAPPPDGFFSAISKSYLIYREQMQINDDLKSLLDGIHNGFVKETVPFSIFVRFPKILLMLFNTKESYMAYTSKPDWSLASTDIDAGAIYIMESADFKGTVVHELTHIVYDGFFLPQESPLWLSEGFAVYLQAMAQNREKNRWLVRNIDTLRRGYYIDFDEFATVDSLDGFEKEDIALWYAQAFSVVDYLINTKSKDGFYQFSKNLKDGMPLGRALFRAYGMPFNTLSALEYAWQADLQRRYTGRGQRNAQ